MRPADGAIDQLFSLLDRPSRPPRVVVRTVAEKILALDPWNEHARALLSPTFSARRAEEEVLEAIEEAEALAAQGQPYLASQAAERVREHFGHEPVARHWLEGAELLWEG